MLLKTKSQKPYSSDVSCVSIGIKIKIFSQTKGFLVIKFFPNWILIASTWMYILWKWVNFCTYEKVQSEFTTTILVWACKFDVWVKELYCKINK